MGAGAGASFSEPALVEGGTSKLVKRAEGHEATDMAGLRGGRLLRFPDREPLDTSDETIVRLLRADDPRAPRLVWQRFAPRVQRIFRRTFGPNYDIDDLVQEVFLVLFVRVPTLREPKALPAFILAITAHTVRRELRRKTARRWLHFGEAPNEPGREADLDSREAVTRLYRVLDGLRASDRTAFVLHRFEGLELGAVADAMGLSLATTKRHLARAWTRIVTLGRRDAALVDYLSTLDAETAS
jgi:RNA polymerase sigma-70 factor (ECF subfamily)